MGYTHEKLKENERRRIERLRASGWGVRRIARALGRSPSTISTEVARIRGTYSAKKAEHKAYVKRKYAKVQSMKVVQEPTLRTYVEEKLLLDWSPQMIAGRIRKVDRSIPRVSIKAIYKFIHSIYGRKLEKYLYRNRVKARGGPKRGTNVLNDGRTRSRSDQSTCRIAHNLGTSRVTSSKVGRMARVRSWCSLSARLVIPSSHTALTGAHLQ